STTGPRLLTAGRATRTRPAASGRRASAPSPRPSSSPVERRRGRPGACGALGPLRRRRRRRHRHRHGGLSGPHPQPACPVVAGRRHRPVPRRGRVLHRQPPRRALAPTNGEGEGGAVEIVVADDGSDDGTVDAARAAGADQVVALPLNRGKGAAVRAGVLAARGRTVAYTDADLAYPPAQLLRLLAEVEAGADMVVGSRRHVETKTLVQARRLRELTGRLFNLLTGLILLGRYRDTQCGLKAFRSDVARALFTRSTVH